MQNGVNNNVQYTKKYGGATGSAPKSSLRQVRAHYLYWHITQSQCLYAQIADPLEFGATTRYRYSVVLLLYTYTHDFCYTHMICELHIPLASEICILCR